MHETRLCQIWDFGGTKKGDFELAQSANGEGGRNRKNRGESGRLFFEHWVG